MTTQPFYVLVLLECKRATYLALSQHAISRFTSGGQYTAACLWLYRLAIHIRVPTVTEIALCELLCKALRDTPQQFLSSDQFTKIKRYFPTPPLSTLFCNVDAIFFECARFLKSGLSTSLFLPPPNGCTWFYIKNKVAKKKITVNIMNLIQLFSKSFRRMSFLK